MKSYLPLLSAAAFLLLAGCGATDRGLCDVPGCRYSSAEWARIQSLANLPEPPPDTSNAVVGKPEAELLGHRFYFDTGFSGPVTMVDMLKRAVPYSRAPLGQPSGISCSTCHLPTRAGGDPGTIPGNVSMGAGMYDVDGQQTLNAAYYPLLYWNGRSDSLWSQALAVTESFVSMNSTRLQVAWHIQSAYAAPYAAVFPSQPLPFTGSTADVEALLGPDGFQCAPVDGGCPAPDCRQVTDTLNGASFCFPRFPLKGKPGDGQCDPSKPGEPAHDAFDCMAKADKEAVNAVFVNYAKALAAYEYKLISRNSAFDKWVNAGPTSTLISPAAQRGAKLFVGKAACIECHNTPLLSDGSFHNVGVPQIGFAVPTVADCPAGGVCDCIAGVNCLPWGAYDGLKKLETVKNKGFRRDSVWSDNPNDTSRAAFYTQALDSTLKGQWRTPSLRDVALTAPYMHNGFYQSLQEVVWNYNQGGTAGQYPGERSPEIKPLFLSEKEQSDLVEFLQTLNGEPLPASLTSAPSP